MKKKFLICFLLLWSKWLPAQSVNWLQLVCADSSNFSLTRVFDYSGPVNHYFMDSTRPWNAYRFHLDEDLRTPAIRQRIQRDEHHPYHHSYIFRDSVLDRLFSEKEKEYLYRQSGLHSGSHLLPASHAYTLYNRFEQLPNGFFFTCTQPVFSQDGQYCFIDLEVLDKTEETAAFDEAYYGTILLIYKKDGAGAWKRWKKIDRLIL